MGKKATKEETYLVERLVKCKGVGKRREFLVKWVGYPSAQNTWEPLANLSQCMELVDEFDAPAKSAAKPAAKPAAAPKRKAEASPAPPTKKQKADASVLEKKVAELLSGPISAGTPLKAAKAAKAAAPKPKAAKAAAPKPKAAKPAKSSSKRDDDVAEVEAVVGIRYAAKGGLEYQIKWKSAGKKQDLSWEPEDNLMDDDLIDDFEEAQQQAVYGSQTIKVGAFVEVRNVDDGFGNSWASAKMLKVEKKNSKVEYTQFVDSKGKKLTDTVPRSRLRLAPPNAPKSWSPHVDEVIEVLENDCWWEARVQRLQGQKAKVQFRVSDEVKEVPLGSRARPCNWLKMAAK